MSDYRNLRTPHWTLTLPADWTQGKSDDTGSLYFESADGSKGVFITTWQLGPQDRRNAEQAAVAFQNADIRSFEAMDGYQWQVLGKDVQTAGSGCIAIAELWAAARHYRAVGKVLAAPPIVVRATFHDYACTNPQSSQGYLDPVIASLLLRKDAGSA